MILRPDLATIVDRIGPGSRVLDIGCGDGDLMIALKDQHGVDARGLEIDADKVATCVARGLSVMQGDADADLGFYADGGFDYVVLSQTLQTTRRPDLVIDEMLRIGRRAFVSFTNFAHWRVRASLMLAGRMPVTRLLPMSWYETPNIHHVTVSDFRALLRRRGLVVDQEWFLSSSGCVAARSANLLAESAVFLLSRHSAQPVE
ncbi:methionine biosynthesis protein MetW [Croceicoccus sp. F390]|uniref:Methionine biosynthesis protein MetW n=1 Tax=Croceicoccus esteveae TaxID=3075597 RepID=A0ABU2ZIK8_9SPHN|nr:methionine biosynthesis protein MetW [Croceicoccus sp. F390]MDT0576139.1 methionine biosynthesis protein MetW [Croceicoccus sp. F390]